MTLSTSAFILIRGRMNVKEYSCFSIRPNPILRSSSIIFIFTLTTYAFLWTDRYVSINAPKSLVVLIIKLTVHEYFSLTTHRSAAVNERSSRETLLEGPAKEKTLGIYLCQPNCLLLWWLYRLWPTRPYLGHCSRHWNGKFLCRDDALESDLGHRQSRSSSELRDFLWSPFRPGQITDMPAWCFFYRWGLFMPGQICIWFSSCSE